MRSPDASWVRRERWDALSADEREKFPPLRPDFVVELRSPSDRLPMLQKRLRELIRNGAQLGWLIDPQRRLVHVYRPGEAVQSLLAPVTISAESCRRDMIVAMARARPPDLPPESEAALDEYLSRPTAATTSVLADLDGDVLILGAGGKLGLSLARTATLRRWPGFTRPPSTPCHAIFWPTARWKRCLTPRMSCTWWA